MNFVIPMAGLGSRFTQAGYSKPKFLVEVKGKTLLEYSIDSLPLNLSSNIIFVILEDVLRQYKIDKQLEKIITNNNFDILPIKKVTGGQAETVLLSAPFIELDKDLVIYNIDTYFQSSTLEVQLLSNEKYEGLIGYFHDTDPKWSFAATSDDGFVTKTTEKVPISDIALTGLYHFSKAKSFFDVAEYAIKNKITSRGEFYVAPLYNILIDRGMKFVLNYAETFVPLGTPEDVRKFELL